MKASSIFLATILGAITLFLLGYLFYIVILGNMDLTIKSVAQIERDPVAFPPIIMMEISYALLLTLILGKWQESSSVASGVMTGALVGLLIGLSVGLEYYATTYFLSLYGVLLKALTFALRFGVAGGVIVLVFKKLDVKSS